MGTCCCSPSQMPQSRSESYIPPQTEGPCTTFGFDVGCSCNSQKCGVTLDFTMLIVNNYE